MFCESDDVGLARGSPFNECDHPCERDAYKAEVEPSPIALGVLRKNEDMGDEPHARGEPYTESKQIFGGLVYSPNRFALRTTDTCNDNDKRPKKQRAKSGRQYA